MSKFLADIKWKCNSRRSMWISCNSLEIMVSVRDMKSSTNILPNVVLNFILLLWIYVFVSVISNFVAEIKWKAMPLTTCEFNPSLSIGCFFHNITKIFAVHSTWISSKSLKGCFSVRIINTKEEEMFC